jgi:hypothetical protein
MGGPKERKEVFLVMVNNKIEVYTIYGRDNSKIRF